MLQSKGIYNDEGKQYHIGVGSDDVGKYVIFTGDPFRTDVIAQKFDNPKLVGHNREHRTWTGTLNGEKVSVISHGMGAPSTAICLEEMIHCGAHTFIRVGTAGRVCEESWNEDLEGVVATAAVRDEGTSNEYAPIQFPAVANLEVTNALVQAYKDKGLNYTNGIIQTKDSFYGQHDPESMPIASHLKNRWKAWEDLGVMASEMESSTLFVVSSLRRVRAGAILKYVGMNKKGQGMSDNTIDIACDALKILIEQDKNK